MRKTKYLIVGQGIAGTVLSARMLMNGINHIVLDQPGLSSTSKIAAGLINPIVLKRLSLVADAELFLNELKLFYESLEHRLSTRFHFNLPLWHIFHNNGEINQWQEKMGDSRFVRHLADPIKTTINNVKSDYGFGAVSTASWLNTRVFLNAYRDFLASNNMLIQMELGNLDSKSLDKAGVTAENIILCNGHLLRSLYPGTESFFQATKGEVLTLKCENLAEDKILHKKIFILPLGNKLFKVGSTYSWKNLNEEVSEAAKEGLLESFESMYSGPYTLVNQEAGIRPNIKDRKPVMGKLENHFVFNGLGSRGALMAPFLSQVMLDFIIENKPIPEKWDIKRFIYD